MMKKTVPRVDLTEKNVLNVASVSSFGSAGNHRHGERKPLLSRYSSTLKRNFGFKASSNDKKEDNDKLKTQKKQKENKEAPFYIVTLEPIY